MYVHLSFCVSHTDKPRVDVVSQNLQSKHLKISCVGCQEATLCALQDAGWPKMKPAQIWVCIGDISRSNRSNHQVSH